MTTPVGTDDTPPPGGQGDPNGGKIDAEPKLITEEEHARRMRGKAAETERATKALEAAQAKLAKIEADAKEREEAALTEQGKHKELAEAKSTEAKTLREQLKERDDKLAAYEAKEQARLDEIAAKNKERLKALPEEVRKGVPKNLDPEALASVLTTIEALIPHGDDSGSGRFSGSPRPKIGGSPEGDVDAANKVFSDLQMGRRAAPGVRR